MSKTDSLHYKLCQEGAKWLRKKKFDYLRCQKKSCHKPENCSSCHKFKYVAVELCTYGTENADVWGYDGSYTAVIEVKTSHSDFSQDKKKWWRSEEANQKNCQAGNYRWYLCPEGVIKEEEIPEGWGLLFWDGKSVNHIKGAPLHENTSRMDMRILYSILRREKFPEKIYDYRGTNTTIHPKR